MGNQCKTGKFLMMVKSIFFRILYLIITNDIFLLCIIVMSMTL